MTQNISSERGTYILLLALPASQTISIGRFGDFGFTAGYYAYVGSAFGSGGLAGRLNHHLHITERPHWHVDYLRRLARLEAIWYQESKTRREHDWAYLLGTLPGAAIPIPRFGASDCRCPSHLFFFQQCPTLGEFQPLLDRNFPADPLLRVMG